jgi:sialate O-acetylesterase
MIALAALIAVQAQFEVNRLFSDHAVLQRGLAIPVFGTGQPGATVDIDLAGRAATAEVDTKGNWIARLRNVPEGGPFTLEVNGEPVAEDVLVGEVWFASGQSNMNMPVSIVDDYALARARATKDIRFFQVPPTSPASTQNHLKGRWIVSDSDTVGRFSAVGFWFARRIYDELKCPIGIIQSAWGGTRIETWMSLESLESNRFTSATAKETRDALNLTPEELAIKYQQRIAEAEARRTDPGFGSEQKAYRDFDFSDGGWETRTLPTSLEESLDRQFDGSIWYRKEFNFRESGVRSARIDLGVMANRIQLWVNGKPATLVNTGEPALPRTVNAVFDIPREDLRYGRNVISMRVFNFAGPGGFFGETGDFKMTFAGSNDTVDLSGPWKYKIETELPPSDDFTFIPPGEKNAYAGAYNGMVAPVVPYGIRGFLWYQGENNVSKPDEYRSLFVDLIKDWRTTWGSGDLEFYFVQIAGYGRRLNEPRDSDAARLREAQESALAVKNTGMATALDLGEEFDIHPRRKLDVGYRLALVALEKSYRKIQHSTGPTFDGLRTFSKSVTVRFRNNEGLYTLDGKPPTGFEVAGEDLKFYSATAALTGNNVTLQSSEVNAPLYVRYAWADNPSVNLFNRYQLPALPFRTDKVAKQR